MRSLTVGDFKTRFSDVLKEVRNGEEFLIFGKRFWNV